ncbi:MAG: cytidylate kinase-like family protein [Ruminococcaceae bacterium]|nr:cytidylate kinase-like family protein [Oscillospiraceae bacterium]
MKSFIICIGRQFMSGGKDIGKMLADKLGVDFYDSAQLRDRAKELGIEEGIFDMFDEKPTKSFLFNAIMDPYSIDSAVNEGKVIEAQRRVILDAASKGPCVIVGRRADKIIEDDERVISIFIGADIEDRVKKYLQTEKVTERNARRIVERKDRERASYYNYFGDGAWGRANNYTMCFSSSKMSREQIVEMICHYIEEL